MALPALFWGYVQTGIALVFQFSAAVIWTRLYGRIRPWSWWCCFLGIILTVGHRLAEIFGFHDLGHMSAMPIGAVYLFATVMALRAVIADEKRAADMKRCEKERADLQVQVASQKGAATALALILNDLEDRISYYERLAKEHGLPTYPVADSATSPSVDI